MSCRGRNRFDDASLQKEQGSGLHSSPTFNNEDLTLNFTERWYQERWCRDNGGQVEVVMPDKTRCDCVTDTHAIEFDFGSNWAEAVGQSTSYSFQTGKRAGIVLILENIEERKYWIRLNTTVQLFNMPIDTWSVGDTACNEFK
jgi:hypothetical protein